MFYVELSFGPIKSENARAADQSVEVWSIQSVIDTKWLIAHDASNRGWKSNSLATSFQAVANQPQPPVDGLCNNQLEPWHQLATDRRVSTFPHKNFATTLRHAKSLPDNSKPMTVRGSSRFRQYRKRFLRKRRSVSPVLAITGCPTGRRPKYKKSRRR